MALCCLGAFAFPGQRHQPRCRSPPLSFSPTKTERKENAGWELPSRSDDAVTLDGFWVLAGRFDRSLYREWKDHWDERGYDEYIIVTEGRLPYCESPEEYVCRMETRREILVVLALCTEKQRKRFLLYALYDLSYEEVGKICGCSKVAVHLSVETVRKKFLKFFQKPT